MKNYSEMHAAVLGSTGSVGRQAIDALTALGVRIDLLCAGNNTDLLIEQINEVHPLAAAVPNEENAEIIKDAVGDSCRIFGGEDAVCEAIRRYCPHTDVTVHAISRPCGASRRS